jgi:hypothetical protein
VWRFDEEALLVKPKVVSPMKRFRHQAFRHSTPKPKELVLRARALTAPEKSSLRSVPNPCGEAASGAAE